LGVDEGYPYFLDGIVKNEAIPAGSERSFEPFDPGIYTRYDETDMMKPG
jgi:hypothetical protein